MSAADIPADVPVDGTTAVPAAPAGTSPGPRPHSHSPSSSTTQATPASSRPVPDGKRSVSDMVSPCGERLAGNTS